MIGVVEKTIGDTFGTNAVEAVVFIFLVGAATIEVTTAGTAGVPLGNVEACRLLVASVSSMLIPPLPFTSAKIEYVAGVKVVLP